MLKDVKQFHTVHKKKLCCVDIQVKKKSATLLFNFDSTGLGSEVKIITRKLRAKLSQVSGWGEVKEWVGERGRFMFCLRRSVYHQAITVVLEGTGRLPWRHWWGRKNNEQLWRRKRVGREQEDRRQKTKESIIIIIINIAIIIIIIINVTKDLMCLTWASGSSLTCIHICMSHSKLYIHTCTPMHTKHDLFHHLTKWILSKNKSKNSNNYHINKQTRLNQSHTVPMIPIAGRDHGLGLDTRQKIIWEPEVKNTQTANNHNWINSTS